MLVLSRKLNEKIILANGITLTVLAVKGKNVRIGIDAPRDVVILREELLQKRRPQCEATSLSNGHKTDGEK
ncbi:MAG: carbon storage regulator [Chloroflexi bacterium]|uniref:carbon storage regulator n=1 Tax=Thermogutta sp. TaxID=1962930 RepID=UPI0019B1321C|nr:carbon storage regulator [Chloroflexota bacterium]MBC7351423.1 carbon storage regulator [Thermogutta sp.]